jgi:hypothetical protein
MSDETTRDESAEEHHRKAQEHDRDERPPEERQGNRDMTDEGLLEGVPGSTSNRPTG